MASSLAVSADLRICSNSGLKGFWLGGDLRVALLALNGEFLLKASDCGALGLALGDLLGLSNVSAPIVGLALDLAWFGAVLPLQVFLAAGGSLGVIFGDVWTGFGVCFGLGVFPRLGVLFLTGEWGILLACRLLMVFVGDSVTWLVGLRLLLGESLLSLMTMRSGLPRLDFSSRDIFLPP